jgi:hypothetical protein
MTKSPHKRFGSHFPTTTYPSVESPGDAGETGGGSGNYAPLEKEINQADKEFAQQDKREGAQKP